MANKGFGSAKSGSDQSAKQFILKFKKYWEDYYCCKTGEIIGGGWDKQ